MFMVSQISILTRFVFCFFCLPDMEKKGTLDSPAVALANNVLPVPGGPHSKAPCGRWLLIKGTTGRGGREGVLEGMLLNTTQQCTLW